MSHIYDEAVPADEIQHGNFFIKKAVHALLLYEPPKLKTEEIQENELQEREIIRREEVL